MYVDSSFIFNISKDSNTQLLHIDKEQILWNVSNGVDTITVLCKLYYLLWTIWLLKVISSLKHTRVDHVHFLVFLWLIYFFSRIHRKLHSVWVCVYVCVYMYIYTYMWHINCCSVICMCTFAVHENVHVDYSTATILNILVKGELFPKVHEISFCTEEWLRLSRDNI